MDDALWSAVRRMVFVSVVEGLCQVKGDSNRHRPWTGFTDFLEAPKNLEEVSSDDVFHRDEGSSIDLAQF